jgi:DNA topoisomerase IA
MFPTIKRMVRLPFDALALKKLSTAVINLRSDDDKDVSQNAREIFDQLSVIEVTLWILSQLTIVAWKRTGRC